MLLGSSARMLRPAIKALGGCAAEKFSCSPAGRKVYQVKGPVDFEAKVLNSAAPVIVNFHADWCDPCKILSSKLEELVRAQDNVDLAVVDVEKNPELVHTFEVKAVPAVLAMRNGFVVDKFIGLMDAETIESLIHKLVNKLDT
ncbi:thioredoxin, mitochondrial [Bacillus rossius redtenbacheri]|uniref:thioredoxin, mitochondrial n=1 Tax=Bacillus rossius redtenbacheri TaxID=93214 RepID=UPI002FDD5634